MKTFVAVCAKNGQRIELSVTKPSLEEARSELHHQGYSIIDIKESEGGAEQKSGTPFYFEIAIEGKNKSGQIRSTDALSAYAKLVDGLHYEVVAFYGDPGDSEEDRRLYLHKVRQMYQERKGRSNDKKDESGSEVKKRVGIDDTVLDSSSSVLAKKVAKYHALIERIGAKLDELIAKHASQLEEDRLFRLKELATVLRQLKNTTNPDKLKIIGEAALEKIGQLEIELLEKKLVEKKEGFLKETNSLLRELGSSKKVVLTEDDFIAQAKIVFGGILDNLFPKKEILKISQSASVENASNEFLYFKNVRELKAYEGKRSEVNKELLKGIFSIRGERRERLKTKLRLIDQNVELLKNRINNRSSSYIKIKRGISVYSSAFLYLIRSLGDFFLYFLLAYSVSYGAYALVAASPAPHRYVRLFAVLAFAAFSLKQARSWPSFSVAALFLLTYASVIGINF